jgi:formylmethanofuran dehydrogenase subunit B
VQGGKFVSIAGACDKARSWFVGERPSGPPECRIDGRPAEVSKAIERAAELLSAASYPLIYGLSRATCEAQRFAVEVAELLEGVLDVPIDRGPVEALQSVGEASCTFGEIRNRADLIVVWNADLAATHPRFIERFVRGDPWAPTSRGHKPPDPPPRVITIRTDKGLASSDSSANERIIVHSGCEFDVATTLRAIVKGLPLDASIVEERTGVALEKWLRIGDQLKQVRYGVLLTAASGDSAAVQSREALAALVRELNEYTRFAIVDLPAAPNIVGAANVAAWRTGFPPSIDFWRSHPRSNCAEFSAKWLLKSREVDAALVICDDLIDGLSESPNRSLTSIPLVALDWRQTETTAARPKVPSILQRSSKFGE